MNMLLLLLRKTVNGVKEGGDGVREQNRIHNWEHQQRRENSHIPTPRRAFLSLRSDIWIFGLILTRGSAASQDTSSSTRLWESRSMEDMVPLCVETVGFENRSIPQIGLLC